MHDTITDGAKIAITLILLGVVMGMAAWVLVISANWQSKTDSQMHKEVVMDRQADFVAMSVYGETLPMAEVVAALDRLGEPEVYCLQMEDLRGFGGGTPYPIATAGTDLMDTLIEKSKDYLGKKVYVYTASPNGYLQLCVSELPHDASNPDGRDQNWIH